MPTSNHFSPHTRIPPFPPPQPTAPVEAFGREPLPPGPLLGSIAKDPHRNFPYDAFSTEFKCDKGPCPGSKQTGCACAKCPCEPTPTPPAPPACSNPTPCGCNTPCVKPMAVAGPSTKTVSPKTGGNGDDVKPSMVPHGTLPAKFDLVKPCGGPAPCAVQAPSLLEVKAKATCPDCCPKPCAPTCSCALVAPMAVAGPSTKTVSPKTGGNGDEVKPATVPHGTLPAKFEPVKPCGGPAPCAVQAPSLLEVKAARDPFVVKVKTESVTIGEAPSPHKGETLTKTKPTESGSWRQPHMLKKGDMEAYLSGSHKSGEGGGLREAGKAEEEGPKLVESEEAKEETQYHARVAEAKKEAADTKEEAITSFVAHVGN